MRSCARCGHVGEGDGPGLWDRGAMLGSWVALMVTGCGMAMIGPHVLFTLPVVLPSLMGLLALTHTRGLRPAVCTQCGAYLPEDWPGPDAHSPQALRPAAAQPAAGHLPSPRGMGQSHGAVPP